MGVQLISVKCPDCGAQLNIEENRKQAFCTYCGAKVLIHNDNEYIYHHIDEAKLKQAETEQIVRLKHLEMEEEDRYNEPQKKKYTIKISIFFIIFGLALIALATKFHDVNSYFSFFLVIGIPILFIGIGTLNDSTNPKKKNKEDTNGKIEWSFIWDYDKQSYMNLKSQLEKEGFTNIQCIPIYDISFVSAKKDTLVKSIEIDNKPQIMASGNFYPPEIKIVIKYHSRK